jgi:hypothetical protein
MILPEHVERFLGRLPRRVAYPLIFVCSVLLWTAIGVPTAGVLARCAP